MILKGKHLGFTLTEIADLLEAEPARDKKSDEFALDEKMVLSQLRHLEERRADLDQAIAELRAAHEELVSRRLSAPDPRQTIGTPRGAHARLQEHARMSARAARGPYFLRLAPGTSRFVAPPRAFSPRRRWLIGPSLARPNDSLYMNYWMRQPNRAEALSEGGTTCRATRRPSPMRCFC